MKFADFWKRTVLLVALGSSIISVESVGFAPNAHAGFGSFLAGGIVGGVIGAAAASRPRVYYTPSRNYSRCR
ncbi:hypothetical protein [Mesorhizobium sp. L-8-3]|uniref:hypothetical protein n=1 Tax=Mesorhizobium sp. L-8-3 TaxID=2744522 RepID=UPI0019286117|nr:hypothetical protein [Mesorhizobium sp. L-8-3]